MKTALWSVALALAFGGVLIAFPKGSEEPMPASYRAWLENERPRGHWVGHDYYHCDKRDGGQWVVYRANGDWYATSKHCWLFLIPWTLDD